MNKKRGAGARRRYALFLVLLLAALTALCSCGRAEEKAGDIPPDGVYRAEVTLSGGSGRASVESPAELRVQDGKMSAVLIWNSGRYDYMVVDGEKYAGEARDGKSVFRIPVKELGRELPVKADTTAMSVPHEIAYSLVFELVK